MTTSPVEVTNGGSGESSKRKEAPNNGMSVRTTAAPSSSSGVTATAEDRDTKGHEEEESPQPVNGKRKRTPVLPTSSGNKKETINTKAKKGEQESVDIDITYSQETTSDSTLSAAAPALEAAVPKSSEKPKSKKRK